MTSENLVHAAWWFSGSRGRHLYAQRWTPTGECRGIVVVIHGVSEYSGRYEAFGKELVEKKWAVWTFDQRGHGQSDDPRGMVENLDVALADIDAFVAEARTEADGKPVVLFGHSMGGAFVASYATRASLDGVMLSGPAISFALSTPALVVAVSRAIVKLVPGLSIGRFKPSTLSRDPKVVEGFLEDPLVDHRRGIRISTALAIYEAGSSALSGAAHVSAPVLLMHGEEDRLVPCHGTRELFERLPAKDKVLHVYPGLRHEILNEPERLQVLQDLFGWLEVHF